MRYLTHEYFEGGIMSREVPSIPLFGGDSPIRVTWGFIVQLVVIVVGMGVGYQAIRSDLQSALREAEVNAKEMKEQRAILNTLQIQIGIMSQQQADFRLTYERDFEKYIREPKTR